MASTARTAAATASVVPFHCIICFEEFDVTDRPPVILPCGHTYVCSLCSKRLTKCMECRAPLFWIPPRTAPPARNMNGVPRYAGRYNAATSMQGSSLKPVEPVPLPLPKNVVLIAMMEAAERQALRGRHHEDCDDEHSSASQEVDEGDEEVKRIVMGVESLSGACGTYAVREEEGLAVMPFDPRRRNHDFSTDRTIMPAEPREPFTIEKGQTVQVVDVENGVARLARGMGYIVASDLQLVKVRGPLDTCCQLEGIFDLVERRKRDLRRRLDEVERLSTDMAYRIEAERSKNPTHPIISPPSNFSAAVSMDEQDCRPTSPMTHLKSGESSTCESPVPQSPREVLVTLSLDSHDVELTDGTPDTGGRYDELSCSPSSLEPSSPFRAGYVDENSQSPLPRFFESVGYGCPPLLGGIDSDGLLGLSFDSDNADRASAPITNASSMRTVRSPRGPSPAMSSSFDSIDFRTGMSGHRALFSSKTADPRNAPASRGQVRMMSEHKGIGSLRGPARRTGRSDESHLGQRNENTERVVYSKK